MRYVPSDLKAVRISDDQRQLVRDLFVSESRRPELIRSGILGRNVDGSTMWGIEEAIDGWLGGMLGDWTCDPFVVYNENGQPLTFFVTQVHSGMAWEGKSLASEIIINAPDAPRGSGVGTAALAICVEQMFAQSSVGYAVSGMDSMNEAGIKTFQRLGYERTAFITETGGRVVDGVVLGDTLNLFMAREQWRGIDAVERELLRLRE